MVGSTLYTENISQIEFVVLVDNFIYCLFGVSNQFLFNKYARDPNIVLLIKLCPYIIVLLFNDSRLFL